MKKIFWNGILLFSLNVLTCSLAFGQQKEENFYPALSRIMQKATQKVSPSVVQIEILQSEEKKEENKKVLPFQDPALSSLRFITGIMIDPEGLVLTAHTNIFQAKKLEVHLPDGRSFPAEKLGADLGRDLALLKIQQEGEKFSFISFVSLEKMQIGHFVAVVGRSSRLSSCSLAIGILSGKERGEGEDLQIDCRVNLGNSGGPLINIYGEALGIVSRVGPSSSSPSGLNSGVGFAVPGFVISKILPDLKAGKNIYFPPPPSLGVVLERSSLLRGEGLEVKEVLIGTPAFRSGIQKGDFLFSFHNQRIYTYHQFLLMLKTLHKSGKNPMEILREGKKISLSIWIPVLPEKMVFPPSQGK